MTKAFELSPPMMPNFIAIKTSTENRTTTTIPVGDLSKQEAEQYAELMKQTFIKHWQSRSKQK